jgi:hypothetical protein
VSELDDDRVEDAFGDDLESDDAPEPEWERVRPEIPEEVPEDWLDQKPFDPSGR